MNICMLAYTFYETDNRVMRYAQACADRGDNVDVVALRRYNQSKYERLDNINVYHIQYRSYKEKKGPLSYLFRLMIFFVKSFFFITIQQAKKKYDVIHVHSVPDFEVFAAIIPKLFGTKIILDIHDIVPEFYASKFNVSTKSVIFKLLVFIEKTSCAFSNHVIISNHLWFEKIIKRSVTQKKCTSIINYPDPKIFYPREKVNNKKKFIMFYPGTVNKHQGVDVAINAFALIADEIPNAEFHIYAEGPEEENLKILINKLKMENRIIFFPPRPLKEIAEIMSSVDLGIIPKRKNSFGNEAFSTKSLEFMALGIPIIMSNTDIDKYYYNDSLVKFFESDNINDLSTVMLEVYNDSSQRAKYSNNGLKYVKNNNWDVKKEIYFKILFQINR